MKTVIIKVVYFGTLAALFVAFTLNLNALAHDGHNEPGALPIPPHGGKVSEAEHKIPHKDATEDELFFEAVYQGNQLRLYPLLLSPKDMSAFKTFSPKKLGKVDLKIEYPRKKKIDTVAALITEQEIKAQFDAKGASRFIVHVSVLHNQEVKEAKIQVEK